MRNQVGGTASSRAVSLSNSLRKVSGLDDPVWGFNHSKRSQQRTRVPRVAKCWPAKHESVTYRQMLVSKAREQNVSPSAHGPASSRAVSLSNSLRKVSGLGDPVWRTQLAKPINTLKSAKCSPAKHESESPTKLAEQSSRCVARR